MDLFPGGYGSKSPHVLKIHKRFRSPNSSNISLELLAVEHHDLLGSEQVGAIAVFISIYIYYTIHIYHAYIYIYVRVAVVVRIRVWDCVGILMWILFDDFYIQAS